MITYYIHKTQGYKKLSEHLYRKVYATYIFFCILQITIWFEKEMFSKQFGSNQNQQFIP